MPCFVLPSLLIAASQPASKTNPSDRCDSLELYGRHRCYANKSAPPSVPCPPAATTTRLVDSWRALNSSCEIKTRCAKGKENKTERGTRVGHRVQFWLGLALAPAPVALAVLPPPTISLLASRLSHLSSEAVDASGSVKRVRASGRLPNTQALPQTCRWVPLRMPVTFPNPPSHCTALHEPRTFTLNSPRPRLLPPLEFDLHTSSTPFYITLSTSAQPSPALPKLRSTPSMRQPRSRDPTTA